MPRSAGFEATPIGRYDHWPPARASSTSTGFTAAENKSVLPGALEGPGADRARARRRTRGLPPDGRIWPTRRSVIHSRRPSRGKPSLRYFATGATHAPHHVPRDWWIASTRGNFDQCWDTLREATVAAQKEKPSAWYSRNAELTGRPRDIPGGARWKPRLRPVLAREDGILRRVSLESPPTTRPRVIDALADGHPTSHSSTTYRRQRRLCRGLVIGRRNDKTGAKPRISPPTSADRALDELGTRARTKQLARGGAHAMDPPYQWNKKVPRHSAARARAIVHGPRTRSRRKASCAPVSPRQSTGDHDIEAAKLPPPTLVNGVLRSRWHASA